MRRAILGLIAWLGLAASLQAATVTLAWDPPLTGSAPTGYRVLYGPVSGQYTTTVDTGSVRSLVLTLAPGTYFFAAVAYNVDGVSPYSNEVSASLTGADPACAFPLGNRSISIFPTGKLNKTGSGGAGSKAYITFQAASPNSPVIFASIRANGVDIPDSVTQGSDLHAMGSLWFSIPSAGTYAISIFARNAYGCSREQPTTFTVAVP